MGNLTIQTARTEGGFNFLRSDGTQFFLVYKDDGSAVLHAGADRNNPPQTGIVGLGVSISDKLNEAQRWVLAYPNRPDETR